MNIRLLGIVLLTPLLAYKSPAVEPYKYTSPCNSPFLSEEEMRDSLDYTFVDLRSNAESRKLDATKSEAKKFYFLDPRLLSDEIIRTKIAEGESKLVIASSGGVNAVRGYVYSSFIKTKVVFTAPATESAAKEMFGKDLPQSILTGIVAHFGRAKQILAEQQNVEFLERPTQRPIRDTVLEKLAAIGTNVLFVVVGHNENGHLKFPDGTGLAIDELASKASSMMKMCMIISCETASSLPKDFTGVASVAPLDPEAVADGILQAQKAVVDNKGLYLGDYFHAIQSGMLSAELSKERRSKLMLSFTAGSVVALAVPVVIYNLKQDKNHK